VTVVIDLDGVVWLGSDPIPGGAEAVAHLRRAGERIVFLTNNSMPTRLQLLGKLARMGIDCGDDELINSPQAAATLLQPDERVLVVGGKGVFEAIVLAGCEPIPAGRRLVRSVGPAAPAAEAAAEAEAEAGERQANVDAVVVGLDLRFDYLRLSEASAAIRRGARFIATNDDATYPMTGGVTPGGGSIVAAIATAAGSDPVIAGKPHDAVIQLLGDLVGEVSLVIGDRASTDGALAKRLGAHFALVTTGVTAGEGVNSAGADVVGADFASVVEQVLA
jgi:phosphoglycolate/pyridoxal phosphate phosphatase family enzyme